MKRDDGPRSEIFTEEDFRRMDEAVLERQKRIDTGLAQIQRISIGYASLETVYREKASKLSDQEIEMIIAGLEGKNPMKLTQWLEDRT